MLLVRFEGSHQLSASKRRVAAGSVFNWSGLASTCTSSVHALAPCSFQNADSAMSLVAILTVSSQDGCSRSCQVEIELTALDSFSLQVQPLHHCSLEDVADTFVSSSASISGCRCAMLHRGPP